jgi:nucleoside-diphosphate-sugar epimerase
MRVFLAGATGAIGRRLVPLLRDAGHAVTGTTRSADRAKELERAGVAAAVLDVFDAEAVTDALRRAQPEVVIHQLTDLPREFDQAKVVASYPLNARIRTEGTRNLIAAAQAASVRRFIVQSIAFAYVPGGEPHPETDPLNLGDPARAVTVKGAADMEQQVLAASGIEGIVLRYGLLYGPATWYEGPGRPPGLHVDAAAQAALLAITRGARGIYNIADDDGAVSIAKARAGLGFDPQFRLR